MVASTKETNDLAVAVAHSCIVGTGAFSTSNWRLRETRPRGSGALLLLGMPSSTTFPTTF